MRPSVKGNGALARQPSLKAALSRTSTISLDESLDGTGTLAGSVASTVSFKDNDPIVRAWVADLERDANAARKRFTPQPVPAELLCPHSTEAVPYLTYGHCYSDRIRKEREAFANSIGQSYAPGSPNLIGERLPTGAPIPARTEYFPIGGTNPFNNSSKHIYKTLHGPATFESSGGMSTTYSRATGRKGLSTCQQLRDKSYPPDVLQRAASSPAIPEPKSRYDPSILKRQLRQEKAEQAHMAAAMREHKRNLVMSKLNRHVTFHNWEDGYIVERKAHALPPGP